MSVTLAAYQPSHLPALVLFLNRVLAGHRHWAPISQADFCERVLDQPAFDPHGLILAWAGDVVVGGVHALKPPSGVSYASCAPGHQIVWLAVTPEYRQQRVGGRLLMAAEDYLRACPVYFAGQSAPLYGIIEKLWAPWYGSTERMGVSAIHAAGWIEWLLRRGYTVVNPGDVSLAALLHERERPGDPGLAQHGLRLVPINQHAPWTGAEPVYRLRRWGTNGGRAYQGLVVADDETAVGSAVWYPLPDGVTAALAWIGLERRYRGLRFGSYLLDRALAEMAHGGYTAVEVHAHTRENPEAVAMFRHRGFEVIDYWVNLAKT
jgi:GNAT superfamily N-acetyltransferase